MRSLRTLLALGLTLAIAVPAAVGAGAWLAAGDWQTRREHSRRDAAVRVLEGATVDTPGLARRLAGVGVEAQLLPNLKTADEAALKEAKLRGLTPFTTPGLDTILQAPDGKLKLSDQYVSSTIALPQLAGTLFVRRESAAARWAISLAAAAVALAAVLALAVALLSRWVLRPLALLAADADRIAGGELAVERVPTRAREVAQVGDALRGMAGGLQVALKRSQEAETERRFLVSAIAHDLRTPLFTLRGSLEALELGIDDGDALARAQRKAAHLDRVVGDLFAFARADYAPAAEPVDLAELARRAAETVDDPRVEVVAPGPVPATGDPVALERVLTNLVENAVRHARARVEITVEGDHGASVVVEDDGPGFAAVDLPHVFEPLYRGDKARGGGGAGLGLAIARRLARAHGGDVEAANGATGARVRLTVPRASAPAARAARPEPSAPRRA